jgi:transcriptional regulator PpsR
MGVISYFHGTFAITAEIRTVNLASPDVTLRLDMDGVIREVTLANSVSGEEVDGWVGLHWAETVGGVGSDQIISMMAEARANGVSDFRQVSQRFPSGLELPVEYNTVRLGAQSGLIAIGKNLQAVANVQSKLIAAQQAREQEAWKLRGVEMRYRMLLDASDDPVLLLRMDDLNILDANPAAIHAGAFDSGRDFRTALAANDRDAFVTMMARVSKQGRAPGLVVHFGKYATPWVIRATIETVEQDSLFLLQLTPVAPIHPLRRDNGALETLIGRLPDGFVLIDGSGIVQQANRAFLDLVQIAALGAVIGQPIGRWLSRPGADAAVLIASINRHHLVRGFATIVQGELGTEATVEISAAGDEDGASRLILLLVRNVSRRLAEIVQCENPNTSPDDRLVASLIKLTEQIGQIPLLDLVRDTGGVIERHCIEDALERMHGNRTAAAELLGMSRQSLYAKLGRYSMGNMREGLTGSD